MEKDYLARVVCESAPSGTEAEGGTGATLTQKEAAKEGSTGLLATCLVDVSVIYSRRIISPK